MYQSLLPFAAFLLLLTCLHGAALAQSICTEPLRPFCIEQTGDFANDAERRRCQSDIEDYLAKVDEFVACLKNQIGTIGDRREQAAKRLQQIREKTGDS